MASLFVIQGRDQGRRFELTDDALALGRDATNDIQLHDGEVSRRHAEVRPCADGYLVADLQSSNGTFVNSRRVDEHVLQNGDRVQLGRTLLIFTATDRGGDSRVVEDVHIVGEASSGSRIICSISREENEAYRTGDALLGYAGEESPWLARARSNLQVMYRTALAVSHTLDIDELLARIMELIFEWVEADRGCVMLVDQQTDELIPKVRQTRKGAQAEDAINISRTILDYVMQRNEGVLTSDAREDMRWDAAGSIVKAGVREAICVPMQGRYGVVGIIYVDTYTPPGRSLQNRGANRFNEEHLKLMVAIGHQAALAIEDTSYYSALVQAERLAAIGQTIAMLSHHIKNILQGIRGGSYLIEEGLKSNEADVVRKGWGIVERNQERISNLVMDMLTFSKEREPEMAPADLNATAADVVELMASRARDLGVELAFQPDTAMPELTFDSESLHRAVLNVVTNALDACVEREGGKVEVSTRYLPAETAAEVVVADNGEGIPAEDLKKIFAIFESKKGSRGTGLGLSVSQKILHEHGGDIFVESTSGVGSIFRLRLPAVVSTPASNSQTITGPVPDART